MSTERMTEVVERIFKRMVATYGVQWARQWDGTPIGDVKAAWAHELSGYANCLGAVAHALDNLPERCPNVIQFKALCRAAPPPPDVLRLDAPKADPVRVAAEIARMAPVRNNAALGSKDWAHRLKARHAAGDKINPFQVSAYRAALGHMA
jgi:hypothetical protein